MIHSLKITNFKSIDSLELKSLGPFSVFAGPNGAGKSNFFDALCFVSHFMQSGLDSALRAYGGFHNLHSQKRRKGYSRTFQFEIDCDLLDEEKSAPNRYHYKLNIKRMNNDPQIEENLSVNKKHLLTRKPSEISVYGKEDTYVTDHFPSTYSPLILFEERALTKFIHNFQPYRIDPLGAKESDASDADPSKLSHHAHNLASVLKRIEKDGNKRQTIIEWMEAIVPGIESVQTEANRLESKTTLLFKESGTRKRFPARMMSDGTVYALSLLVAVLDQARNFGLTMIEEPERGLHPKVIFELVELMREQASSSHPIWLTTHSESVIRVLKPEELILVDKVDGRTRMKHANEGGLTVEQLSPLNLDEAWLSNLLNGGVPW